MKLDSRCCCSTMYVQCLAVIRKLVDLIMILESSKLRKSSFLSLQCEDSSSLSLLWLQQLSLRTYYSRLSPLFTSAWKCFPREQECRTRMELTCVALWRAASICSSKQFTSAHVHRTSVAAKCKQGLTWVAGAHGASPTVPCHAHYFLLLAFDRSCN